MGNCLKAIGEHYWQLFQGYMRAETAAFRGLPRKLTVNFHCVCGGGPCSDFKCVWT
jgi:hypothetical protein